ncbi:hypothetical protein [Paracnuella aquatica]|uniref:hypothetical protein n=1 Tax=Paracnuella aquatica TaxID=2268757 RepID=UPI000DEF6399|nr:hypothetical protein [Paracnuella aquatica]RPD50646.1 hypothetical protein DRJ53_06910 [Paracnuella aquatica]
MRSSLTKGLLLTQEAFMRTTFGARLQDIKKGKLADEDAVSFKNFWLGTGGEYRNYLHAHFPFGNHKQLYKDLVSTDAAAINFFLFIKQNKSDASILKWLGNILCFGSALRAIESIEFGYPSAKYGTDIESVTFHIYLKILTAENLKIGIGFSFSLAENYLSKALARNRRIGNKSCLYNIIKQAANLNYPLNFQAHSKYREHVPFIYRHSLAATLASGKKLDQFRYIHMFPPGNELQYDAAIAFKEIIIPPLQETLNVLDFETFIGLGLVCLKDNNNGCDWLSYLERRYGKNGYPTKLNNQF